MIPEADFLVRWNTGTHHYIP